MRCRTTLVLDAMGVMYQPADDVADLLIPFVRAKGCERSDAEIARPIPSFDELTNCDGFQQDYAHQTVNHVIRYVAVVSTRTQWSLAWRAVQPHCTPGG